MTRGWRRTGALLTAMLVTAAHAAAQDGGQQPRSAPVFRAGADVVTVDVSVRRDRRPVTGLTAADFELKDNGVAQQITGVAYERLPIDVTLLLDVSASVTGGVLDELRRALRLVVADLQPADRLRLITFNMGVRRLVDFGENAAGVDQALASLGGAGSSAVLDALAVALAAADSPGRRRFIVLFSDGQDSASITDPDTLLAVARRSSSTLGIVLGTGPGARPATLYGTTPSGSPPTVAGLSERLARETGGIVTTVSPGESLSASFRRLLQEFRSSYVLYFSPQGVEPGGTHTLDVQVSRPAGVEVRARRAYVWQ